MPKTITPRTPMYYDSFGGLIPCRFVEWREGNEVAVRIGATGHGYREGEVIEVPSRYVVPTSAVKYQRTGTAYISGVWTFPPKAEAKAP